MPISTDPVSALAHHRAFTHSIAFAVVTPLVWGALVHRIYHGKGGWMPRQIMPALLFSWVLLAAIIYAGSAWMPYP
ncbi:MAG: hypothetical protein R2795_17715 [Saprospiraceae bacterium]